MALRDSDAPMSVPLGFGYSSLAPFISIATGHAFREVRFNVRTCSVTYAAGVERSNGGHSSKSRSLHSGRKINIFSSVNLGRRRIPNPAEACIQKGTYRISQFDVMGTFSQRLMSC
jgi:hypothetical protein